MAVDTGAGSREMGPEAFELEAETLRALAHPKRLMILSRLGAEGRSVSELAGALGISMPNASQHLRVLRERGVVRAERVGHAVRYRLTDPQFQTCCRLVRQVVVEHARRREAGLRAAAEPYAPVGRPPSVDSKSLQFVRRRELEA